MGFITSTHKKHKHLTLTLAYLILSQSPHQSLASETPPPPLKLTFSEYLLQTENHQSEEKDALPEDLFSYENLPTPFVLSMEDDLFLFNSNQLNENDTSTPLLLEENSLKKFKTLKALGKFTREAIPIAIDVAGEAVTIGIGCVGVIGLSMVGMFVPSIAPLIIAGTVGGGTWAALRF